MKGMIGGLRVITAVGLVICALFTSLCQGAELQVDTSAHWRALSDIDSRAALKLIEDNHPGASPALNDKLFLTQLDTARKHVLERVPKVVDYPGYRAVMAGLATDFKDGHIWARPTVIPSFVQWTGMMLSRRDHQWIVASQYPIPGKPDVVGARLQSCDGVEAEAWSKERIALFHGNAEIEADLIDAAPWLLLDEGNPFLKRPKACVFQRTGEPAIPMTLYWGSGSQDIVTVEMEKAQPRSEVGLGIATVKGGYWISLGTLRAQAANLVAEAKQQQLALQNAKLVVIDLRGNGGGDSTYAWDLAKVLVGDKRVDATYTPKGCEGAYWRVSEANIAARESSRSHLQESQWAEYDSTTDAMRKALAAGQPFSPALPSCAAHALDRVPAVKPHLPHSSMKGRLVIVTDHLCFSSCLLAVDLFKKLGAVQVGEATNVSLRYMEVRQTILPSGLTYFSTLQKVSIGDDAFGPYEPNMPFPGQISDTGSLQTWVEATFEASSDKTPENHVSTTR